MPSVDVVTTPSHPTTEISEVVGLVIGVSGATQGLFSFRSQQDLYEKAIEGAKFELAVSAVAIQASAVIGVQAIVNSNNPGSSKLAGGGMKSTETMAPIGTAVKLVQLADFPDVRPPEHFSLMFACVRECSHLAKR